MSTRPQTLKPIILIAIAPVVAAVIGSVFNIWYNVSQVEPLLTEKQNTLFHSAILYYNLVAYPPLLGAWLLTIFSLNKVYKQLLHESGAILTDVLSKARVRTINLPWRIAGILAIGWMLCIPALLYGLQQSSEPVDSRVLFHLPTSVVISALITVTHAFFLVELLTERLLFPVFFDDISPARVDGAVSLPLNRRTMLTAFAICVCPVLSLVLLAFVDADTAAEINLFMVYVGAVGIVLGLFCSWMFTQHVTLPVETLTKAAHEVGSGNLDVAIDLKRSDEFGPLIEEFNRMVEEMRSKRELRQRFGLHVGRRTAELILASDPGLTGTETEVTVMFCDIRNFTARCAETPAEEIVPLLNRFLTMMVDVVENQHHGNVNKFLGDGFMALFGIGETDSQSNPASEAVAAGLDMIQKLKQMNAELDGTEVPPLGIGIGINAGIAIVGSMGSNDRLEYTAIGDTVNLASRIEGLTKPLERSLLVTKSTAAAIDDQFNIETLEPQKVKGKTELIEVFAISD